MAAFSGFITGTCSVNGGTKSVTVTLDAGSSAVEEVASGTAIFINNFPPVEAASGSGTTITLAEDWPHANQVGEAFTTIYTIEGLRDAATFARQASTESLALASSFEELLTSTTPTVTIGTAPNELTLTPYQYLVDQFNVGLGDIDAIKNGSVAPSKAEFEARTRGKYAGSGFVHFGKQHNSGSYSKVNQGIWAAGIVSNELSLGRGGSAFEGVSTTDEARTIVNDSIVDLYGLNRSDPSFNPCAIILPPAPDGLDKRDGTGRYPDLTTAVAAGTVDLNESMINASDITILRSPVIPNDIATSDKVYPNSLKQFGATSLDGVSTNDTEQNPMWTDAIFSSDDTTAYKCWEWSALSDANKAIVRNNLDNNIYSDNGVLKQRTLEVFTHRINNADFVGDIENVFDVMAAIGATFDEDGFKFTYTDGGVDYEVIGVDQCSRLNQGGYHPTYNSMGTKAFNRVGDIAASHEWYESLAKKPLNKSNCFDFNPTGGTGGTYFVNGASGGISNGSDGRMDGNRYDSIQAGQIKDLRIDAGGTHTPQTAHHTLSKRARNGEARGWERLPRIRVAINSVASVSTGDPFAIRMLSSDPNILGDISWMPTSAGVPASGWLIIGGVKHKIYQAYNSGSWVYLRSYTLPTGGYPTNGTPIQAVFGDYIDAPYSEGLFQNITGTPAEIAATFPDGVMGEWIPVIPDGTVKEYKSTKKNLEQYQSLVTSSSGATWSNDAASTENTGNSFSISQTAGSVRIIPFRAKANFTEETEINNVEFLHGDFATEFTTHNGVTNNAFMLAQSVASVVPTDTAQPNRGLIPFNYFFSSYFATASTTFPSTTGVLVDSVASPSATSDGIQWETRVTSQDNLASLVIPYRQIKHDGSSYGAGLTFNYVDNTSNALDDNGQLIQVGSARSLDDMNIILRENFNV
jgi:hypothetical protein